jgi:hypothetical protein
MCKRMFLVTSFVLLLVAAPSFAAETFENAVDVTWPPIPDDAVGSTVFQGMVTNADGELVDQYLITGYGKDIWDGEDQFHFAYRTMTGGVRISAAFEWVDAGPNDWAKYGVMLRDSTAMQSTSYQVVSRKLEDLATFQVRSSYGAGAWAVSDWWKANPQKLGIQRVMIGGLPFVEGLVDWGEGAGWERVGDLRMPAEAMNVLPDEMLVGVCVTSHTVWDVATTLVSDIRYEIDPQLVGATPEFTLVPASAVKDVVPDTPGFQIHSAKPLVNQGWGWAAADELLNTGLWMGAPVQPGSEGIRIDPVVNLRDTGNGAFGNDRSYPGIDPFEFPAGDPAAGDDDNDFGTQILANVYLTAGLHMMGADSDDGTILEIGGVEVGRTNEWQGASIWDFIFEVEAEGWYSLRALTMEGGGGASIELHEILADGTRILLGDTAAGGSPVVIPEPATIALLSLGGLALLRRKRS